MRDSLTGARTRLTLHTNLSQALDEAQSSGKPCSIAILDQNEFKHINDRWGHVVGDNVLSKTADLIQNNLRLTDLLFRVGGDEWLILMPKTSKHLAQQVMARLQEIYSAHEFQSIDGHPFSSSFSYGTAESSEELSVKEWLTKADEQLYTNKQPQT